MTGRVATLGEALALVHATELGSLAHVDTLRLATGGAEANVAIGLSRLGVRASWTGRVGDDSLGIRVARELRAEGVDTRAIVDGAAPTGLMLKEWPRSGQTSVAYYRRDSAGSRLGPGDVVELGLETAALLHVTGITPALSASAREAVDAAVDAAVRLGVPVSFDVNHRTSLWGDDDPAELYRSLARRATVVFAGDDEARILAPQASTPEQLARAIASLGPAEVVIKLGAEGALALIDGELHQVAAVPVPVVDTVGAGDAFVAGYLAERVRGLAPRARLQTAALAGAFACTNAGDWEGYPRRADLERGLGSGDPVSR